MPEDGPLDLGDKIVWFKSGAIHRADGPAMEFKDGRKLWALDGREVSEPEFIAYRQENERKARELADQMCQSHEAAQLRQYHTGLEKPLSVRPPLKPTKKIE
ncbi:MAG: hypothetical protein ABI693_12995 [Bryobacteraceae bacterium]